METIGRNLEDLIAFHQVATERSFTRAAERLGTSKAMVSKQVKRLETYLRTELFHRTTRSLSLTESGFALLSYSQKIIDTADEADRNLKDILQGGSGVVRISSPISLGQAFFPSFIPQMARELPDVRIEADLSNERRDLQKDGVDFALRADDEHPADVIARYLGHTKDVICVQPELLKKLEATKKLNRDNPRSLAKVECILHSHEKSWNDWSLSCPRGDLKVQVNGSYATNQYTAAHVFCQNGLGVARLPKYLVQEDLQSGRLVQLFPEYGIATHPLYLIDLKTQYVSRKHSLAKEQILDWFRNRSEIFA